MQGGRLRPTRYAHFEGHTDLCYSDDGKYIITCGTDGEVRIFEGLDDDDCKTHVVADCASAIAYRDGCFLVGNDSNLVQAFTLEDGSPSGIITRFSAPATHIVVGCGGKRVACAGSDMTIRVHDPVAYKDKEFTGHKAPVLSVALDPKGEYLASSSCDGSVRIWSLSSGAVEVSWAILPQTNSFSSSNTLCRLAFTPSGHLLAVPVGPKVLLYDREGWRAVGELSSDRAKETISIVATSPCGGLVAGACRDGTIVAWSLHTRSTVMVEQHPKGLAVCGLVWHPSTSKKELAFVDIAGQLGTVVDIDVEKVDGVDVKEPAAPSIGLENGAAGRDGDEPFPPMGLGEEEEEGEDEFSLSKIKADLGFADDEEGTFLGLPSAATTEGADGGAARGEEGQPIIQAAPRGIGAGGVRLPEVQKPFQPGMSPEHLTERYMLWNTAGIIRQYAGEEESSIDVEFHDSSVHHSLHLNNSGGHTMAALSTQVLVLASESQEEQASKLMVQQLSGGKEWHLEMPEGEDILALAVGNGWLAAATERRNLRIFGTSGTQRDVVALPGPVVCLAGFEDLLMVVFHSGVGVSGDQHMSTFILSVGGRCHPLPQASPLPLSPKSFLAWAGFTDEGTPLMMDSSGVIRMVNRAYGWTWTPVLNTRAHVRSKSDHYFLVGANEVQGHVRCVLCKGARFPPILPKPHVSLLNMKLPLCEGDTEKGELEERMSRSSLLLTTLERLSGQGTDVEGAEEEAERMLQEAMIKLFALACRSERECRGVEVCRLMPSYHTVELAIKYSAKLHRLQLAERLGEVAAAKVEEEGAREERKRRRRMEEEEEEEEDFRYSLASRRVGVRRQEEEEEEEEEYSHPSSAMQEEEEEEEEDRPKNPLLEASRRRASYNTTTSTTSGLTQKNPFKKNTTSAPLPSTSSSFSSSSSRRSIDIIDSFRRAMRKETTPVLRPVVKRPQNKQKRKKDLDTPAVAPGKENQLKLDPQLSPSPINPFLKQQGKKMDVEEAPASAPSTPAPPKQRSALQMWLDDNVDVVKDAHPNATGEKELLLKAAVMFKDLDAEVKQKYKTMAAGTPKATPTEKEEERKRPREEEEDKEEEIPLEKKTKGSGLSKLSAFMFNKDA